MKKIVVDTNFLLLPVEYRIDLHSELLRIADGPLEIILPSGVISELRMLSGKTGRRALAARFALQLVAKWRAEGRIEEMASTGRTDGWIVRYAAKNDVYVATNDISVLKRVLSFGRKVISLQGKSKLAFA